MANGDDEEINVAASLFRDPGYTLLPYNPEPRRDHVRAIVTISLVVAFFALLADACVAALCSPERWAQTKEMLQILLPALTGLLGSALGFYFGTKSAQDE